MACIRNIVIVDFIFGIKIFIVTDFLIFVIICTILNYHEIIFIVMTILLTFLLNIFSRCLLCCPHFMGIECLFNEF